MSTYAAYDAYDCRITSVFADSPKKALERLTQELQRPGRLHYYDAWKDAKFPVTVDDSVEKQELLEMVSTSPVVIQDAIYREITIQNQNPEEKLGATDAWVIASRLVDPKEWEFHTTRRNSLKHGEGWCTIVFKRIS